MFKRQLIGKDAFISSTEPFKNYGKSRQLYVTNTNKDSTGRFVLDKNQEKRSLFWVDIEAVLSAISDVDKATVEVSFPVSNYLSDDPEFKVNCHPLTKSFYENYGSDVADVSSPVNWQGATAVEPWTTEGGDYNDAITIPSTFDKQNSIYTVDLTEFIKTYNPASYHGFILVADGVNRNFAMYSSESDYAIPYVNIFENTFSIETGDNVLAFPNNEVPEILLRSQKYRYHKGETLEVRISLNRKYATKAFENSSKQFYSPNLKYRLIDIARNRLIVDYRDETRIDVTPAGNILRLSLDNLLSGFYEMSIMNDNGILVSFGTMEFKIDG